MGRRVRNKRIIVNEKRKNYIRYDDRPLLDMRDWCGIGCGKGLSRDRSWLVFPLLRGGGDLLVVVRTLFLSDARPFTIEEMLQDGEIELRMSWTS